ncbi:MAG: DUF977 family protein [Arthrobacter sp.]|jgi:response regulator of citrate/malate metabolism|nr:DUF977 family protein [Arthrobacter sp.]
MTAPVAPRTVLIVDDDPQVARIHAGFIATAPGYTLCAIAATAAAAREAVQRHRPDLVLLDVHLPDGNGVQLLPSLRTLHPGLEAIVITAAREQHTVAGALRGGAVGYLIKPFSRADLESLLAAFLDRAALGRTSAEVDQADVDRLFGARTAPSGAGQPPAAAPPAPATHASSSAGMNQATLDAVRLALVRAEGDLSASEAAAVVGVSRVSARRYLEHLLATGAATVQLRYGAGRPERRYRLR